MASGAAVGGLIPSLLNVAIIGVSGNSAQVVGLSCFCISTLISLTCLPLTYLLQRNQFFRYYGGELFHKNERPSVQVTHFNLFLFSYVIYIKRNINRNAEILYIYTHAIPCYLKVKDQKVTEFRKDLKIYYNILKNTWVYLLSLLITFSTTLMVFPAVTALIQPSTKGKNL